MENEEGYTANCVALAQTVKMKVRRRTDGGQLERARVMPLVPYPNMTVFLSNRDTTTSASLG